MPRLLSRRAAIALFALIAGGPRVPRAETVPEGDVEARTLLLFRAPDKAVQALLPPAWRSFPLPAGPGRGANLNLVFADRLLSQDAAGHAITGSTNPSIVLAVPARNAGTGEAGMMVSAVFAPASLMPGPGDPGIEAEIKMQRTVEAEASHSRRVQEHWNLSIADGGHLDLRLRYAAGPPTRVMQEQRSYSVRRPELAHVWRVDQGVDVLRGAGIADRVEDLAITAKGAPFTGLLDGTEQLAAIISLPWYIRRTAPR